MLCTSSARQIYILSDQESTMSATGNTTPRHSIANTAAGSSDTAKKPDSFPAITLTANRDYVERLDEICWKDRLRTRSRLATIALAEYAIAHGHAPLPRRLDGRGGNHPE